MLVLRSWRHRKGGCYLRLVPWDWYVISVFFVSVLWLIILEASNIVAKNIFSKTLSGAPVAVMCDPQTVGIIYVQVTFAKRIGCIDFYGRWIQVLEWQVRAYEEGLRFINIIDCKLSSQNGNVVSGRKALLTVDFNLSGDATILYLPEGEAVHSVN